MLGIAIIFAISAVYLAQGWLNRLSDDVANVKDKNSTTIVVPRTALEHGAIVRAEQLALINWPSTSIPKGAFHKIEELVRPGEPRVVLKRIEANEPILESKVSGFGGRASLSTMISNKMRATTIRVDDVNGVAGFVLPGDRVDVLLTRDATTKERSRDKNSLITDVLLQNIKVLAIDQEANDKVEKPSVAKAVTLEVTSNQSQKLVLAQKVGALSLALRNVNNNDPQTTQTVRISDLRVGEANTIQPQKISKKPKALKTTKSVTIVRQSQNSLVKVTRGTDVTEYTVTTEPNKNANRSTDINKTNEGSEKIKNPKQESKNDVDESGVGKQQNITGPRNLIGAPKKLAEK